MSSPLPFALAVLAVVGGCSCRADDAGDDDVTDDDDSADPDADRDGVPASQDCDDDDPLRRPAPTVDPGFVTDRCGMVAGGFLLDGMDAVGAGGWQVVDVFPGGSASASLASVPGCSGDALALTWSLQADSAGSGSWIVARRTLTAPVGLDPEDVLLVPLGAATGAPPAFRLELKLEDAAGCRTTLHVPELTALPVWRTIPVPLQTFASPPDPATSTCATGTDLSSVTALEIAISDPDGGGGGVFHVDDLTVVQATALALPTPTFFECPLEDTPGVGGDLRARIAADFLQRRSASSHGFFPSWYPEIPPRYYVYTQALATAVLSREAARTGAADLTAAAAAMADQLVALQANDGSWFDFYSDGATAGTLVAGTSASWEGNVAWSMIGLASFVDALAPNTTVYDTAIQSGADWLEGRVAAFTALGEPPGGVTWGTEGNVSSYFALVAAGRTPTADAMADFLLTEAYDAPAQRFRMGINDPGYALDVVANWGGAFLRHRGLDADALAGAALGGGLFAAVPFAGGDVGLGDIWAPWAPAVEFTAQYCALGGPGTRFLVTNLLALESSPGVFPSSTDDFSGGPGWLTTWEGATPSAWMYLCLDGGLLLDL